MKMKIGKHQAHKNYVNLESEIVFCTASIGLEIDSLSCERKVSYLSKSKPKSVI